MIFARWDIIYKVELDGNKHLTQHSVHINYCIF